MVALSKYRSPIMGISILWIMFFHSGLKAPDQLMLRLFWYVIVNYGAIGVDVFLICSGMGVACSAEKNGKDFDVFSFYKRRLVRILPAYFIVATLWYLIKFENIGIILRKIFFLNFFIDGERDFWYIPCILICYLLFPLYTKVKGRIGFHATTVIFVIGSASLAGIVFLINPILYEMWEILLWRLISFWIGCHIGYLLQHNEVKEYNYTVSCLTVISLALLTSFWVFRAPATVERLGQVFAASTIMLIFAYFSAVVNFVKMAGGGILSSLGRITLELYLIHVSLGGWLAKIVLDLLLPGNQPLYLLLYFILSILMSAMLHSAIDMIMNKRSIS